MLSDIKRDWSRFAPPLLRSGWWWGFMVCGALSGIAIASICGPLPLDGLGFWVWVAERFYGDLDAPDNWALGLTCCAKAVAALLALASIMGLTALLGLRKKMRADKATRA